MFPAEIFGPDLLIAILIGAVVFFGGSAIPKLAKTYSAKTEFEKGLKDVKAHTTMSDFKPSGSTVMGVSETHPLD